MIITTDDFGTEYVTIENNGHFTTIIKEVYDAQQAEHLNSGLIKESKGDVLQ